MASYIQPTDRQFLDAFTDLGLSQMVMESTNFPSGNIIDLCLLSHPERLGSVAVKPPLPSCSHGIIRVQYTFQSIFPEPCTFARRMWTKGNYRLIANKILDFDWDSEFCRLGVQEMYDKLMNILKALCKRFIPESDRDCSKPPWTLNPPRSLITEKVRRFEQYKEVRRNSGRNDPSTLRAWQGFTEVNNRLRTFAKDSQKDYEKKVAAQLKTNPKLFHGYLRHRRVGRPTIGPLKLSDNSISDDPKTMAQCFMQSFAGVFTDVPPQNPAPNQMFEGVLTDIRVSPADVEQAIKTLDVNSSMGFDGIHPRLLVRCAAEFSHPLSKIFNESLRAGILPIEWLSSQVTPIFKKGPRLDPLNYRPVSITSVPCKTLEKVIASHMRTYLEENNLLSENQFGFRSKHSTTDQLLLCYNDITREVDQGKMTDMIFFDFSKAFDKVCHSILIGKLRDLGFSPQLTRWIQQFLTARRMQVRVHGAESTWCSVSSGVPQGSVLGPILFLIYVNHVVQNLSSKYKIFADDIKLYVSSTSRGPSERIAELQQDINMLVRTGESWGLMMNVTKCVCLRFGPRSLGECSRGRSPYFIAERNIKFVASHLDLGVRVDRALKFHEHVRKAANSCNAVTTNMLSSTICREQSFIVTTYKTLVQPILEYGCTVWNLGYLGDLKKLERIQRRWTRAVLGFEGLSYAERLRRLDLFSVQGRLLRADMILTWKIFAGACAIQPSQVFVLDSGSRRGHSKKLYLPRTNLEVRKRFFTVRVIQTWNSLSEETVSSSTLPIFKCNLHRDLGQQLYDYSN